jgi:hypothetical protein
VHFIDIPWLTSSDDQPERVPLICTSAPVQIDEGYPSHMGKVLTSPIAAILGPGNLASGWKKRL